jgi:4-hydroxy-3-methylbut-2-enyl diphosphate reductase
LREIGTEADIPAFLIADQSELDYEVLSKAKIVGLTAGASAPEILVEGVIEALRSLGPVELTTLPGVAEDIEFKLPAELNE